MDIRYETILFKCQIGSENPGTLSDIQLDIAFFDLEFNTWSVLLPKIPIKNGLLAYAYTIPKRIPSSDTQSRKVRDSIYEGSIPMFRITKSGTKPPIVISQTPEIMLTKSKLLITLDFGKQWPMEQGNIADPTLPKSTIAQTPDMQLLLNEITKKEEERTVLQEQLTTISSDLNSAKAKEAALLTENKELQAQLEKYITADSPKEPNEEAPNLIKQLEEIQTKNDTFLAQNTTLTSTNAMLEQQTKSAEAAITDLTEKLTKSTNTLAKKDATITELNQTIAEKEKQLTKVQTQLIDLQNYTASESPNKVPAKNVYQSIVSDIAIADEQMDNSRFKLSNISMNLKATVEQGPEGTVLGLIDFASAKNINGAAISDISIDIVPNHKGATKTQGIPKVLGLTESAVRNVLINYGLKLEAVYQPTENPNLIAGQSFRQFPEEGVPLIKGQEVTVIFSKPLKK